MTTITAAVAREQGKPLVVEQLELDDIRPNEARVRLVASGACHTDAIVRDGVYRFPFDQLIKTYALEQVNQAFADLESGRVVKPVVVY